jgi:drug/metabolite transporter (DMT)-like permease
MSPLLTAFAVWLTTKHAPSRTTIGAIAVALLGVVLVITRGDPTSARSGRRSRSSSSPAR